MYHCVYVYVVSQLQEKRHCEKKPEAIKGYLIQLIKQKQEAISRFQLQLIEFR